jgi:hypothetical protein
VAQALNGLLGRDKVGSFLQMDGFVRAIRARTRSWTCWTCPA